MSTPNVNMDEEKDDKEEEDDEKEEEDDDEEEEEDDDDKEEEDVEEERNSRDKYNLTRSGSKTMPFDDSEPSTSKGSRKRQSDTNPTEMCQQKMTRYLDPSSSYKEIPTSSDMSDAPSGDAAQSDEKLDMSFYKLRWFTFKDYDTKNVREVIETKFDKSSLEFQEVKNEFGFHIYVYQRETDRPNAKPLPSVKKKRNITHDVLIFFFIKDINPKYAFCLCSGHSYKLLEGHTESRFSRSMAKHFMDGTHITSKEVVCIAGPSVSESLTFPPNAVLLIRGNYEKIITGLTAQIREGTKLAEKICDGKSVLMTLGQKRLKIHKTLDIKSFSEVLNLFIEVDKTPDCLPEDPLLVAALDHTELITRPDVIQELEKELMKVALKTDAGQTNVYFSNRKVEDWFHASDIKLISRGKKLKTWTSAPTFDVVRNFLRTDCQLVDDQIQIEFTAKDKSVVKGNLKQYIHGSTMYEDNQYHKVAGKWYWLSTQYRTLLTNRMATFLESNLIKQGEIGYLPLPWKPQVTPSMPDSPTGFEFLSKIPHDQLMSLLKNEKVSYLGQDEVSCLKDLNCKFIKSTSVYKELQSCLKTKQNSNKDVLHMISGLEHAMMKSEKESIPLSACITNEVKKALEGKQTKIVSILQTPRVVIDSNDVNPNVTNKLSQTVYDTFRHNQTVQCTPEVVGKEVLCYLRTLCNMEEGDYNETYQSMPEKDDGSLYMMGDRVQAPPLLSEMFDVLYYQAVEPAKLYLYHVKEGFGNTTRDACSQIRVSANLLWQDLMDSSCSLPNIAKLRELAVGYKQDAISRIMLKRAVESMPDDEFKSMFRDVSEIVFVYAFMDRDRKDDFLINVSSMSKLPVNTKVLAKLKRTGYADRDGSLTDSFFLETQKTFKNRMNDKREFPMNELEDIHRQLSEQIKPKLSTIALVELTTLAEEFTKFQCSARRFSLKICQISTCNT